MKYVLTLILLLCVSTAFAAVPDDLQGVSVTIKAANSQGSGSLVTRQISDDTISFVWTAAHVVDGLRTTRSVIVNGQTRILVEYKDAEIVQELQQEGRRIGEVKYEAKVIKVSDASYGEDLALLMVRRKNAYPLSISTKFKTEKNYIPAIGTKLVHVGSLLGQFGANSFTNGLISQTGRTLAGKDASVKVFDQTTVTAFPGSSGGGVFIEDTGEYVGMLTHGVQQLQGFNFIVPVRRIHEWATSSNLEWAVDPDAKVPTMKEINALAVEDSGTIKGSDNGMGDHACSVKISPKIPTECDGTYEDVTLPCKCASIHLYTPDTCPCFGKDMYPDLYKALMDTYDLAKDLGKDVDKKTEPTGEYKAITLECSCVLCVYVPGSSKCLEKKYPDLSEHLQEIYDLAEKYQEKNDNR